MSTRIGTFLGCIFGLFLAGEPALAAPAAYPDREIRLIVPYKTGGQSDLTARKLAKIIRDKKLLPQPVVVVNIPGANTSEGLRAAMRADPDGYTLLLHHSAFVTMKALGQISMSWHDFEMIGQALEMSNSLVVNLDSRFRTISEFIEAVKKEPGKYHIAIPGLDGVAHLALLDVLARAGIQDKVEIMPFDGACETAAALMGGRVDMRAVPNADMARFVIAGEQRVLLVMGDDKLPGIRVPCYAADLGLKNTLILHNGVHILCQGKLCGSLYLSQQFLPFGGEAQNFEIKRFLAEILFRDAEICAEDDPADTALGISFGFGEFNQLPHIAGGKRNALQPVFYPLGNVRNRMQLFQRCGAYTCDDGLFHGFDVVWLPAMEDGRCVWGDEGQAVFAVLHHGPQSGSGSVFFIGDHAVVFCSDPADEQRFYATV